MTGCLAPAEHPTPATSKPDPGPSGLEWSQPLLPSPRTLPKESLAPVQAEPLPHLWGPTLSPVSHRGSTG